MCTMAFLAISVHTLLLKNHYGVVKHNKTSLIRTPVEKILMCEVPVFLTGTECFGCIKMSEVSSLQGVLIRGALSCNLYMQTLLFMIYVYSFFRLKIQG